MDQSVLICVPGTMLSRPGPRKPGHSASVFPATGIVGNETGWTSVLWAMSRSSGILAGAWAATCENAIFRLFLEIAAPSLIFWPSFTGVAPGSRLRNQSWLSRVRLVCTSSK